MKKTVFIFGASGRLGKCISDKFESEQYDVYKFSKTGSFGCYVCDLTNENDLIYVKEVFNKPDILIHCVHDPDMSDRYKQFLAQYTTYIKMVKRFIENMSDKKWGRVISIQSVLADQNVEFPHYASAKRAVNLEIKALIEKYSNYGITFNEVMSGWAITENERLNGIDHSIDNQIPMKRRGHDYEIADAVLFLASHKADYITGAILPVTGGIYINKL